MSDVDTVVIRIQEIAKACIDTVNGSFFAPDYPTDDATKLPMVITHIKSGNCETLDATALKFRMNFIAEFHFDRSKLDVTYKKIDALIPEFLARLGGDPSLKSAVSTIMYPVAFEVIPSDWNTVVTECVEFTIPVKFNLQTPKVTA